MNIPSNPGITCRTQCMHEHRLQYIMKIASSICMDIAFNMCMNVASYPCTVITYEMRMNVESDI